MSGCQVMFRPFCACASLELGSQRIAQITHGIVLPVSACQTLRTDPQPQCWRPRVAHARADRLDVGLLSAAYQAAYSHFTLAHACMEAYIIPTHRTLSVMHPVRPPCAGPRCCSGACSTIAMLFAALPDAPRSRKQTWLSMGICAYLKQHRPTGANPPLKAAASLSGKRLRVPAHVCMQSRGSSQRVQRSNRLQQLECSIVACRCSS